MILKDGVMFETLECNTMFTRSYILKMESKKNSEQRNINTAIAHEYIDCFCKCEKCNMDKQMVKGEPKNEHYTETLDIFQAQ